MLTQIENLELDLYRASKTKEIKKVLDAFFADNLVIPKDNATTYEYLWCLNHAFPKWMTECEAKKRREMVVYIKQKGCVNDG